MKPKEKRIIYILMIGFIISSLNINIIDFQEKMRRYDKKIEETPQYNLKSSGYWLLIDTTIFIDDTAPYWSGSINWTTAAAQDWCTGAGTMGDPYIIENLTMIGYDYQACIWIMDSNVHFIIRNCTFINAGKGLDFMGAIKGKLINSTFTNNTIGVSFSYCQDFTISDNKFDDNYHGVSVSQGDNYNISKNSFNNNYRGLQMINNVMNSLIYDNTFEDNQSGIYFYGMDGENNNISSNIMNGCGFDYYDHKPPVWGKTNIIETSNLVNSKPLYFYQNELNLRPVNFTNAGQVLLIESNNTLISDLNISNCTVGISMNLCRNNTLIDSNFSNSAIDLRNSYNITLNNNIVSVFDQPGINLYYGNGYNLTNNQMFNSGFGIWGNVKDMYLNNIDTSNNVNDKPLYYFINKTGLNSSTFQDAGQLILIDCEESSIMDFDFSNCYIGILGYNCNNNTFSNITSRKNFVGIYLFNCSNNRILNWNIRDCFAYGLSLIGKFNMIEGCNISNSRYSGIDLYGEENIVKENTLDASLLYGISVNGDYNNITDNEIFNNKLSGIHLGSNGNEVINNNITQNQVYGLDVWGSYNTIAQNNISKNKQHGIFLRAAHDNWIIENDIFENEGSGIFIFGWNENNDIIGNDIKFNHEFGIFLHDDTNFNTIYNNNFTGNLVNAEDNSITNVWNNGTVGNYWDDYSGVDDNDNGIGDTPYINISGDAGTQDIYPIWWDSPAFSIISPIDNQMLGKKAPEFSIEIEKGVPYSMWYILNYSSTKYFFTSNDTINQGAWDTFIDNLSTLTISFFINDSRDKRMYNEIIVRKDNVDPIILINLPQQNEEFGLAPPTFELLVIEDFPDEIWYTLNDGITNHSCGLSGQINQTIWDILPGGTYNLRFYASDTGGNVRYSEIIIIKTAPPTVPSFNNLIIFLTIIISMISISWKIRKKR